jgi:predicted DNA-binding transcriptional regulator AlpA
MTATGRSDTLDETTGQGGAVEAPKRRPAKPRPDATFVTKSEIARELGGVAMSTIDRWIAAGTFPPPHSRIGPRYCVWLRQHWRQFVETGRWPERPKGSR